MALLDTLAAELLGPRSLGELSSASGASTDQTRQLVAAALPLLLSGMHRNSATAEGAQSLAKALEQHAPDAQKSTSAMLKKADVADGKKIVKHVFGDDQASITKGLAQSTGLKQTQVTQMLGQLAPVVLSLVGDHKEEQAQSQGSPLSLTSLLGGAMLGSGYQQVQAQQQSGLDLTSLAGSLLGSGAGASLLGSLLGGGTTQQAQAQTQTTTAKPKKPKKPTEEQTQQSAASGGLDLSGLLMGLLK